LERKQKPVVDRERNLRAQRGEEHSRRSKRSFW
jgi:hypothetical protein